MGNEPGSTVVARSMEQRTIDIKTTVEPAGTLERLPRIAGPSIWYALAGVAVILSCYLFLFADHSSEIRRFAVSVFVGLWAPMFGILGLRAEMIEMREDLMRRRRR